MDICCEGSIGPCKAEIAEAADGPDEVDETGWGRVVERPAVGSAFPDGQMPLELFLRVVHVVGS